jgi:glucosamine--fructose-6-phosphate aminotransferase (isomerizing)
MSIMLREIREQPRALARTLEAERDHVLRVAARLRARPPRLVVLVARGTSDNAALFGRYLIELAAGIPVSLAAPSIHTLYRRPLALDGALVIGLSQSGAGHDVNLVLESCKRAGATVLAVTNTPRSAMAGIAHETFVTRAGKERSVAATKTYTCQLLLLYMLAEALRGGDLGRLDRIPEDAGAALALEPRVAELVERYRFMDRCVVIGRGLNYATAHELALKLMETCYVMAEPFSSADLAHGPVAVIERHFPVFLFAPPGRAFADLESTARRLRALDADALIVSSEPRILAHATCPVRITPRVEDFFSPIPYIVPGQILAALLAREKGLSPDRPRGLTKVTRTL